MPRLRPAYYQFRVAADHGDIRQIYRFQWVPVALPMPRYNRETDWYDPGEIEWRWWDRESVWQRRVDGIWIDYMWVH